MYILHVYNIYISSLNSFFLLQCAMYDIIFSIISSLCTLFTLLYALLRPRINILLILLLNIVSKCIFLKIFFCLRGRLPSLPWDFLLYFTMILQRLRIVLVDAGFEPGTSAPEVWCATNEPPPLNAILTLRGKDFSYFSFSHKPKYTLLHCRLPQH